VTKNLPFDDEGCAELARVPLSRDAELLAVILRQADELAFAIWRRELVFGEWTWTADVIVVPEPLAANLCDGLTSALDGLKIRRQITERRVLKLAGSACPAACQQRRATTLPTIRRYRKAIALPRILRWLGSHLLSFEAAFALFLYSNELKTVIHFPFPVDETLMFAILAAGTGALIIYREGIYLRGLPVLIAAMLFIFWVVVSVTWSPSRTLARSDASYLLTFTMFSVVAGCLIVANRRERAIRLFSFVLLIAMSMTAYGLYIYFSYGDFRRWAGWKDLDGRVYLAFGHTVVNGAGIAFCIAMFSRFSSMRQGLGAALFTASAFFLLVGGGRGPFLGVVLAALTGLTTRPPSIRSGRVEVPYTTLLAFMLLAIGAAYVGYSLLSGHTTTTIQRFANLADRADHIDMLGTSSRQYYWISAYHHFLNAPIIGNGLRSFSVLQNKGNEADGSHPHNIILQILAETGVIGLVLFLFFIWIAARHISYARLRRDPLLVCALIFLITSSMSPLFGRDLVGVRKFFFAVSLLALRPSSVVRMSVDRQAKHSLRLRINQPMVHASSIGVY
jgi:O-antigen ligase